MEPLYDSPSSQVSGIIVEGVAESETVDEYKEMVLSRQNKAALHINS